MVASQRRAPLPEPPRTEVAGTLWNGQIVVLGGLAADRTPLAEADAYDPVTDSWRALPALPVAVHHAAAGSLGGRLYLVGGWSGPDAKEESAVFSLGAGDTQWRPEPALAAPRAALALATLPNALVAVGGVTAHRVVGTTEILEVGATSWRRGPDLIMAREHLAATASDGRVYAIAGRVGSLESNRDAVESLALGDAAWREEPKLNHSRGGIGAATLTGAGAGIPCVAGGEEPGDRTIAPIECLRNGSWRVVAQLDVPRHGLAVSAIGRRLHAIAGGPKPDVTVSDVHEVFEF